jgi:hypothetical protein
MITPQKKKSAESNWENYEKNNRFANSGQSAMSISPQKESGHKKPSALSRMGENQNQIDKSPLGWIEKFEKEFFGGFEDHHKQVERMFKGIGDVFKMPNIMESFGNLADFDSDMHDFDRFSRCKMKWSLNKKIVPDSLSRSQGPSKVMMRSYVSSTKMDPQGRKYEEKYFSNDFAMRDDEGQTVFCIFWNLFFRSLKDNKDIRIQTQTLKELLKREQWTVEAKNWSKKDVLVIRKEPELWDTKAWAKLNSQTLTEIGTIKPGRLDFMRISARCLDMPIRWKFRMTIIQSLEAILTMILSPITEITIVKEVMKIMLCSKYLGDIQPTIPNRGLPAGPIHDQRPEVDRPLELDGPRMERNERRFEPVQTSGTYQRNDGNFYNKNARTSMPRAGWNVWF